MRTFVHSGVLASDEKCVAYGSITTVTSWTVLPLGTDWGISSSSTSPQTYTAYRKNLPFPCTPCITYYQTNGTPSETQTFSVRITGRDQFGTPIQEQLLNQVVTDSTHTPGVPTSPYVRKTRLWCAKVFSVIDRVEYQAAAQGSSDQIAVGVHWDFDYSGNAAPYENYIGQANQGIGTIGLINAYTPYTSSPSSAANALVYPDLMGLELVNLDAQAHLIVGTSSVGSGIASYSVGTNEIAITAFSSANPTVVTCAGHGVLTGNRFPVRIYGVTTTGKTYLNGEWMATFSSDNTHFTIPANNSGALSALTTVACYIPGADVPIDRLVPTIIQDLGVGGTPTAPSPVTLNGYHEAFWASSKVVNPSAISATTAGTGGWVQVLRQPVANVQAYNSSLTAETAKGGFRLGTNASGFNGTAHKWNIYKAFVASGVNATSYAGKGIPLMTTNQISDVDLSMSGNTGYTHFPWRRNARIAFTAYYHTSVGYRPASNASSYVT